MAWMTRREGLFSDQAAGFAAPVDLAAWRSIPATRPGPSVPGDARRPVLRCPPRRIAPRYAARADPEPTGDPLGCVEIRREGPGRRGRGPPRRFVLGSRSTLGDPCYWARPFGDSSPGCAIERRPIQVA